MDSLPIEIITNEIFNWLLPLDKQILRRTNKKFCQLISYEVLYFNYSKIELIHLIKYKRLWNNYTISNLAKAGNLDCLKYAHENSCSWDVSTTMHAAMNGHLDCLKYAHENGCLWDENTTMYAASKGHLDCLR